MVAAIVVASVSFSLLTSAVATSRLQVQGTVEANFRPAYDILVRPPGSKSGLERSDRLVRENFLSGIFGGITMDQYHQIADIPGVQVAAPVAMVGYMLPSLFLKIKVTDLVTSDRRQLFRIRRTWVTDRGLSRFADPDKYIYVTGDRVDYAHDPWQRDPITGKTLHVCTAFDSHLELLQSPFDLPNQTELSCYSTNPVAPPGWGPLPHGQIGTGAIYPFPVLLAAIDPVQEAKLVGLDHAIVSGRYLRASDRTHRITVGSGRQTLDYNQVPVLLAGRPLTDETLRIQVQRLRISDSRAVPGRLASKTAVSWLRSLPGNTLRTKTLNDADMYPRLLQFYSRHATRVHTQYWSSGQVDYTRGPNGDLRPVPRRSSGPDTWIDPLYMAGPGGLYAPQENADVAFRPLQVHVGSNVINAITNTHGSPIVRQVGVFDPRLLRGFSRLSRVPLTTYYPPSAAPGDTRTSELLAGRSLAPNANLAGYLQQPPMMLTTLRSLHSFTDATAFSDTDRFTKAPISVIRVRVAGVTGADELSRERVRLVAERIERQTGLDVDITIGSSPTPELIDLPAGRYGRPELTLKEGWVLKGVSVRLLSAVDTKSLALFGLVLVVCLLFLLNATIAAVRTRRPELGVLACLGWPARRIFVLLETELLATGLLAGLAGTTIAATLVWLLDLQVSWIQLALITPVATALAALAGVGPAWRACHATPLEAITPAVRAPRKASRVDSITRLAVVGVARWPGRTILGAASLFIGVAALAVLVAIQQAFKGEVAGTLLGDVISVQVRGVDYLAAALTIVLGAFAVADIAYLNISERAAEVGTLRATGWGERHLRQLFGTEALLTATIGALAGATAGVTAVAALLPVPLATSLIAALAAAGTGIVAAALALTGPLAHLNRLAPATATATE